MLQREEFRCLQLITPWQVYLTSVLELKWTCRRMEIFWATNVTHRRSLQEIMAMQRWLQLSKERQKFPELKQAFELTAPGEAAWGDLPGLKGEEKSRGLKVTPHSVWFQKSQRELFCTFWNNTRFLQEITKFWVFILVRKENLKDFLNFWQTGNLIPHTTRLPLKY